MEYIDLVLTDADKAAIGKEVNEIDLDGMTGLVKKVGLMYSNAVVLSDPLIARFKRQNVPLGAYTESYNFESLAQAVERNKGADKDKVAGIAADYDPYATDVWAMHMVQSKGTLHTIDRDKQIPATLHNKYIFKSFTTDGQMSTYIAEWFKNYGNKIFLNDLAWARELVFKAATSLDGTNGVIQMPFEMIPEDAEPSEQTLGSVRSLLFHIRGFARKFAMPSDKFNKAKRDTQSAKSDLVLLVPLQIENLIPQALSGIYHENLIDVSNIERIAVPSEVLPKDCFAYLIDARVLAIRDQERDMTSQVNNKAKSTNFWANVRQYNYWHDDFNACRFMAKAAAPSKTK